MGFRTTLGDRARPASKLKPAAPKGRPRASRSRPETHPRGRSAGRCCSREAPPCAGTSIPRCCWSGWTRTKAPTGEVGVRADPALLCWPRDQSLSHGTLGPRLPLEALLDSSPGLPVPSSTHRNPDVPGWCPPQGEQRDREPSRGLLGVWGVTDSELQRKSRRPGVVGWTVVPRTSHPQL